MNCPDCGKKVTEVDVFSACVQRATVSGKKIIEYGAPEVLSDTFRITCPECQCELDSILEVE